MTPPKNSIISQPYSIIEPASKSPKHRNSKSPKFEEKMEDNEEESDPNSMSQMEYTVFDPLPDKWMQYSLQNVLFD